MKQKQTLLNQQFTMQTLRLHDCESAFATLNVFFSSQGSRNAKPTWADVFCAIVQIGGLQSILDHALVKGQGDNVKAAVRHFFFLCLYEITGKPVVTQIFIPRGGDLEVMDGVGDLHMYTKVN